MARLESARLAIGGKPPKPKPGGCPHCTAKAIQNIGLPRIKFNLEGLPRRPIALYHFEKQFQ